MAIFPNPENALKRADELVNVGQKQEALLMLHGLITSKSFKSWEKPHENIIFRYMELCVELRRVPFAKDGLIQYRNSCLQVNLSSFEEVTKHLLYLVTEKTEQALEEALDVDDLETDNDFIVVRSDREVWFKFSWEAYRTVLEITRNNSNLEELYAMTAHNAFQFCKRYNRTTEFRKLCEIIRNHLASINIYRDQRDQPDLTKPESLELYLITRFEQLQVATELGLWQEAFRSVEDIYGLMSLVKKTPKSSLLAVYYSKLIEIFRISSNHLYHAYAWFKLFSLQKNFNKYLNQKDLELIASSVFLAALSVPPFGHGSELEYEKEHNLKMANLIEFNLEPESDDRDMFFFQLSRESILSELISRGVLSCATQEVKDLYHIMENEFQPLDLGSKIKPLLDRISKLGGKLSSAPSLSEVQLSQYVPSLEKRATLKLLQQVSKMYQTIRIEYLAQLIPFFDFSTVEKISVDAVKSNFFAMKVDHVKGVVVFGNLGIEESDCLRNPLAIFGETMNKVSAMLFPALSRASNLRDIVPNLEESVETEHKRLLARKSIIEKRKEEHERQLLEMEREGEQIKLKLMKLTEEAEKKRLAAELEWRKRQRTIREIEEKVIKQTAMDKAMIEKRKEDEEKKKKLEKLFKNMDYLERAKREETARLIEAAYQQRLVEDREFYDRVQQENKREAELSRERHEKNLMEKRRLVRISNNKDLFEEMAISFRQARKEELILQLIEARHQAREIQRKRIYYLRSEEERRRLLLP